jgi:hypothetical protein
MKTARRRVPKEWGKEEKKEEIEEDKNTKKIIYFFISICLLFRKSALYRSWYLHVYLGLKEIGCERRLPWIF